jgi:hypothetical protein
VSKALMPHCFACPKGPVLEMPRSMRNPKWLGVHRRGAIYHLIGFVIVVERLTHEVDVFCEGMAGALSEHDVV